MHLKEKLAIQLALAVLNQLLLYVGFNMGKLLNSFLAFLQISKSMMSLSDIGYICLSSIVSVFIHEVGHALAAARLRIFFFWGLRDNLA